MVIPETPQKFNPFQPLPSRVSYSKPKNTKMMLGIGGIVLAIIIAIAASFSGILLLQQILKLLPTNTTPVQTTTSTLSIQTDFSSYKKKILFQLMVSLILLVQ